MNTAAFLIVIVLVATALWFVIRALVRSYSRFSGTRSTTCPENGRPVLVEVDALHASITSSLGPPELRLKNCSRWPLKQDCGQECLANLDVAPDECLVSGVLMRWYRDKRCIYCGSPFPEIHLLDHKPALRKPQGDLVLWREVELADLNKVLDTYLPVCWNCYITQSFRLDHPELVVYRPWRNNISGDSGGSPMSRQG